MRQILVPLVSLLLLTGGETIAQEEPDSVPLYFAVGIPDGNLPTIDGNNADWGWVPSNFEITIEDMTALVGGIDDSEDLFIDLLLGWNPTENRIYAMAHVSDDSQIIDKNPACAFRDDVMECHLDPDNQGGGPFSQPGEEDLRFAYQMCFINGSQFSPKQMYLGWATFEEGSSVDNHWYMHQGGFVDFGHSALGNDYFYEVSIALFDPIAANGGPDASTRWNLTPESTIGWSLSFDDADEGTNALGNEGSDPIIGDCPGPTPDCPDGFYWQGQLSMAEQFMNTGGMPDVFMDAPSATAVEATSWGQLKTLIRGDL